MILMKFTKKKKVFLNINENYDFYYLYKPNK